MTIPTSFLLGPYDDFNLLDGAPVHRLASAGHRESETIQAQLLTESEVFTASLLKLD